MRASTFNPWQTFVAIAASASVVTCLVGYVYYRNLQDSVLHNATHEIFGELLEVGNSADVQLDILEGITYSVAAHSGQLVQSGGPPDVQSEQGFNDALAQRFPKIRTIVTIDRDGTIRSDTREGRPAIGINVSDREYFTAQVNGDAPGIYISQPIVSRVDGKWTWVISEPVLGPQGEVAAVVISSVDRRYFLNVFNKLPENEGLGLALVHEAGVVLEGTAAFLPYIGKQLPANGYVDFTVDERSTLSDFPEQPLLITKSNGPEARRWPVYPIALAEPSYFSKSLQEDRQQSILLTLIALGVIWVGVFIGYKNAENNRRARVLAEQAEFEAQVARDAANRANEAKSLFLASMSHEIRTPLNAVVGFAESLEMGIGAKDPKKRQEILSIIASAGRQLNELLGNILEFSRVESGHVELEMEPLLPSDVFKEVLPIVRQIASDHGVSFEGIRKSDSRILAEAARLKQVFLNLISNAAKYNRPGGTIEFGCDNVPGGRVRIYVSDTGIGMSESTKEQIFSPFARGRETDQDKPGAGLGLSICKQLVERMNGEIGFTSTLGQGTTFWMEFPVVEEEVAAT